MDKESFILSFIAAALAGLALYAVIHELQPVLIATVQYFGIVLIIITMSVCFGGLFALIVILMDRPYQGNPTTGSLVVMEFMKQRRVKQIVQESSVIEPDAIELPEILRDGRYLL